MYNPYQPKDSLAELKDQIHKELVQEFSDKLRVALFEDDIVKLEIQCNMQPRQFAVPAEISLDFEITPTLLNVDQVIRDKLPGLYGYISDNTKKMKYCTVCERPVRVNNE